MPLVENRRGMLNTVVGVREPRDGLLETVAAEWRPGGQFQGPSEGGGRGHFCYTVRDESEMQAEPGSKGMISMTGTQNPG